MPLLVSMIAALPDPVRWLLRTQGLVVAAGALLCWLVFGLFVAQALVLGGMAGMLGSWAYAWRAWRLPRLIDDDGNAAAAQAVPAYRAQLAGEAWRLAATVSAFMAIFAGPVRDGLPALPVLLGFGAAHMAYWAALLRQRTR